MSNGIADTTVVTEVVFITSTTHHNTGHILKINVHNEEMLVQAYRVERMWTDLNLLKEKWILWINAPAAHATFWDLGEQSIPSQQPSAIALGGNAKRRVDAKGAPGIIRATQIMERATSSLIALVIAQQHREKNTSQTPKYALILNQPGRANAPREQSG